MLPTETTECTARIAVFSKPDDIHELADVLKEELGLHPSDAMHEAHLVPCVLTPRLTSANADRIATAIEQLGIRAEAVPSDELQAFDDLHTAHHVACRMSGLEILDLLGLPAELIPWDDLLVLSIGETPTESSHQQLNGEFTMLSSARPVHGVVTDTPAHTIELWIVYQHPERVYRLDGSKLNFESLCERKTNSTRINMRFLLQEIFRRTPHAHLTPAARQFLDQDQLPRFRSPEQLQSVTQLHLLMAHRLTS
ncbi:MAG: hypothetical protein NT013_27860 [Planctomycetia bacterium]|nr:hypothetical protein [Planctomycetia bacterium]